MNSGEMGLAHRNCSARSLRAVLGQSPSLSSKPCFSRQEWHQGLSRPALPCLLKWFPSPPPTPTQILLPRPACCLDLFSPSQCLTQPGLGGVGRDIVTPPSPRTARPKRRRLRCLPWDHGQAGQPVPELAQKSCGRGRGLPYPLHFLCAVSWGWRLTLSGPRSPHLCHKGLDYLGISYSLQSYPAHRCVQMF